MNCAFITVISSSVGFFIGYKVASRSFKNLCRAWFKTFDKDFSLMAEAYALQAYASMCPNGTTKEDYQQLAYNYSKDY